MSDGSRKDASANRRQKINAGLQKVGTALQKLNLAKLIDDMEHDQELADNLDTINEDIKEESQRKDLVREAYARCVAEIESHLTNFLAAHPHARYEEWIQDLHPDNVSDGNLFADLKQVDFRFYVADSDHRILWNQTVAEERQVEARTYKGHTGSDAGTTVDLLDS